MVFIQDLVNILEDGEDIDVEDIIEEIDDEVESLEISSVFDIIVVKGKGKGKMKVVKKITKKIRLFVWEYYIRLKNNYNKCCCNYCGKKMFCVLLLGILNLRKYILVCKKYLAWKVITSVS